jgi:WD40 repeat protein
MERYTDTLHTYCDAVRDICYDPSGNHIAGVAGSYLHIWNVKQLMLNYKQSYVEKLGGGIPRKVVYSHNGNWISLLAKDRCVVINAATGEAIATTNVSGQQSPLQFTADDSHVILAMGNKIILWNYQTNNILALKTHGEAVTALALSRDGHLLASGDARGQVFITDLRNNTDVNNYMAKNTVLDLAFFYKSPMIASTDSYPRNLFYDFSKKRVASEFVSSDNGQLSIDVSPDDATCVVAGGDGRVYVHEVETGKKTEIITAHNKVINTVRFSPDGKRFASCGNDGTIRIFSVQKATHLH